MNTALWTRVGAVGMILALVGCTSASPGASAPVGTSSGSSASTSPASANPSQPSPSGANGSSSAPSAAGSGVLVDLVFSGTTPFTAKGTGGKCDPVYYGSNKVGRVFDAGDTEFPGLGMSFGAEVSDLPNIKWWLHGDVYYIGTSGLTLSADGHTITLDVGMLGAVPAGQTPPGPEHVKGTVFCP